MLRLKPTEMNGPFFTMEGEEENAAKTRHMTKKTLQLLEALDDKLNWQPTEVYKAYRTIAASKNVQEMVEAGHEEYAVYTKALQRTLEEYPLGGQS